MKELFSVVQGILAIALYILVPLSYLHGVFLSFHDGFGWFVLAVIFPPYALIVGFIGFF